MSSNPAGYLGSLPQGGPGQGYLPQGGGVWSPFAIGRPILLLDGAKGITLNGADVSGWADQSGNGNDLVQATAADQFLFNASDSDFNGQPSVQADGLTQFLQSANFTGGALTQPTTRICVYKFIDNVSAQTLLDSNSAQRNWFRTSGTTASMSAGTLQNIHTEDTDPHVFIGLYNGASSDSYRDGTQTIPAGTVGTQTLTGERIGSRIDPLEYANAKVAFNAIYNFELTAAQRNYMGRGLAARFGTTDGWA